MKLDRRIVVFWFSLRFVWVIRWSMVGASGPPQVTRRAPQGPQDTAGHRRAPQGTAGLQATPQGAAGRRTELAGFGDGIRGVIPV